MDKILRLYKSLSDNQRYNFWSAATNLFLCMFTFWLGITIQFIVVDKTIDYQSENARIEFMKHIGPDYKNLLHTSNYICESVLNQELYDILKTNEKKELNKEQIKIINKFDSNYKEIMSNVDQFIESAVSLVYVLPLDNEKREQILCHVYKIKIGEFIINAIRKNIHIDSLKSVIDEYHKSDEFIIANRTFVTTRKDNEIVEELVELVREYHYQTENNIYAEKFASFISFYIFSSLVCNDVLEICQIYENELYGGSKEVSISQLWNDVPLFYKSFLVLICTIVIGYLFCVWFLGKLSLPSDPKRDYTAEQYKEIKNERDKLHNLVIVNATTMERQTKDINDLQDKVRDLEELNWKYYNEINRLKNN